ncbi:leucine-rich repeat and transmembrane domain-containing protein 1 [Microcaecilia unicolor]|uniref:Leucine-rich repeat and transmembrane domain-containing protein 1 n=1 Tax=Microcaecilia unicolor TaxID=1415580 RepID=A0A6P7Y1G5_9AMPH|nr:leucine-rich repeat and transmembrane domain-containing protein 1 [Microcaecilia unicolor]
MKGGLFLALNVFLLLHVVCGCPEMCLCRQSTKTVNCNNKGLAEIPTNVPSETRILYLQNNNIQAINNSAFVNTPWLTIIDLSNNSISSLPSNAFLGLHFLQTLNLTNNLIHDLENNIFNPLQNLTELDLSSNNIVNLPESLGNSTDRLTLLTVKHNQLQSIDRALLDSLSNLKTFLFKDNPWQCSCQAVGLKLWLESFLYRGGIIDEVVCLTPENWKGKDLLKIPYEFYVACHPQKTHILLSNTQLHNLEQQNNGKHGQNAQSRDRNVSDCEVKSKPRPVSIRHAIATVIITGVVCGIVSLMMLAAAIYGCAYAAIMAKYHRELKEVEHLAPATELGSPEEKEPLDGSLA